MTGRRVRVLFGTFVALLVVSVALAPVAGADTVADAVSGLRSGDLYVGSATQVTVDRSSVQSALARANGHVKVGVLDPDISVSDAAAAIKSPSSGIDGSKVAVALFSGGDFIGFSGYYGGVAQMTTAFKASYTGPTGRGADITNLLTSWISRVQQQQLVADGAASGSAGNSSGTGSGLAVLAVLVVALGGGLLLYRRSTNRRRVRALSDARAAVMPLYDQLAGELNNLDPKDNAPARQALADAAQRYTSTGGQLATADSVQKFFQARQTCLQGLYLARSARVALGIDPGPDLPGLDGQRSEQLSAPQQITVQGQQFNGYPGYRQDAPYYYGGGYGVPGGWYGSPFWETLLLTSALSGGFGGMGWGGGYGYGGGYGTGYDQGFESGRESAGGSSGSASDWGGGGGGNASDWGGGGGGSASDWGGGGGGGGGGSDW